LGQRLIGVIVNYRIKARIFRLHSRCHRTDNLSSRKIAIGDAAVQVNGTILPKRFGHDASSFEWIPKSI
jgi:hypothetical protein